MVVSELIPPAQFADMVRKLPELSQRSLLTFLYLTGARISEALLMRSSWFKVRSNLVIGGKTYGTQVILWVPTLKKRESALTHRRQIPLWLGTSPDWDERALAREFIEPYINQRMQEENDTDVVLWPVSRTTAWAWAKKLGKSPHFWRHHRTAVLLVRFKLRDSVVLNYHNWADSSIILVTRYSKSKGLLRLSQILEPIENQANSK